jgi:rhamnulokinase
MASPLYIAVDLGAGSGRVYLAGIDPGELFLEELHRFQYPPRNESGHLRWDFSHIFEEIKQGLKNGGIRAAQLGRSIRSIGVDSRGVDYGLLNAAELLASDPSR